MTTNVLTANQFPGQPRTLPPLLRETERLDDYNAAAIEGAPADILFTVYADVGQRLAKAMHSEGKL